MSDYPVMVVSVALGFFLGNAVRQVFDFVKTIFASVSNTVNNVFSTALSIRDAGTVMVIETYETAVMLARNILDGILIPIYNGVKDVILIFKPVLDIIVPVLNTVIALIRNIATLVSTVITGVSGMLTKVFNTVTTVVNNATDTVTSYAHWFYNGTDTTYSFLSAIIYFLITYIALSTAYSIYKRFAKKTK